MDWAVCLVYRIRPLTSVKRGLTASSSGCCRGYLAILLGLWMKIRFSLHTSFKSVLRSAERTRSLFSRLMCFRRLRAGHLYLHREVTCWISGFQFRALLLPKPPTIVQSFRVWLIDRTLISPILRGLHRPSRWTWCHSMTLFAPEYPIWIAHSINKSSSLKHSVFHSLKESTI